MKTKVEVFNKFTEFKGFVENQIGRKIKVLWSDGGGEYTSKRFDAFCRDAKIKRKPTIPYNTQRNGVAERKN
jgi:transposase InsO family protein